MKSAIFLDRDGTINSPAAPHQHITTPEAFTFLPGALDALAFLAQNSERRIVVCTNQSCIGRGTATREQVDELHRWMAEQIWQAGGPVIGVYVCPHAPWEGCRCRKPAPGMFLDAAREMGLDLAQSVAVGDSITDIEAAWAAGVRECYRVRTGASFEGPVCTWSRYTVVGTLSEAVLAAVGRERCTA